MKDEQSQSSTTETAGQVEPIVMCGVTEYAEEMEVSIRKTTGKYSHPKSKEERDGFGREVIHAINEGGHNCTEVDLEQLLKWVAENRPQQYANFITENMMRDYT